MSAAPKYLPHYTVDDYRRWEGDWELWDGIPISMSPSPFGKHQMVLVNLVSELRTALRAAGCNATVLCEIDWIITRDTILRPDALVVCGDPPEKHVETAPAIVAEILSPTTADRDRTYKKSIYEQSGADVYIIIDPENESIEAYRLTKDGYQSDSGRSSELAINVCDDCVIKLDTGLFFVR